MKKKILTISIIWGIILFLIFSFLDKTGYLGNLLLRLLNILGGKLSFTIPFILILISIFLLKGLSKKNFIVLILLYISLLSYISIFYYLEPTPFKISFSETGFLGQILTYPLFKLTSYIGSLIILFFLNLILAFYLIFNINFLKFQFKIPNLKQIFKKEPKKVEIKELTEKLKKTNVPKAQFQRKIEIKQDKEEIVTGFPLTLLERQYIMPNAGDIKQRKDIIRKTLENFGIKAEMGDVFIGPTVTQFTLKPAEGTKLSRILSLQNEIALALASHPIRIEAPIPGKSLVGIEVPNKTFSLVRLRNLLESKEFKFKKNHLSLPIGVDVSGNPFIVNLKKMPHLLIAGATGSGKSVCIHSIILSLIYQNPSNTLKFILIDPKRVELTLYEDIPYLLTPVIKKIDKAILSLKWVIEEMDKRYDKLSEKKVKNIEEFNYSSKSKLPYIIIIIDELADLMTIAPKQMEAMIIRLAQMARAVGIHLILSTQRPSVDIITGLIKANITSRIAFAVASQVDSRTILDSQGAEKLLGRGDMLYISSNISKPKRLQGTFVSSKEIKKVVKFLKKEEVQYETEIIEQIEKKQLDLFAKDPLLEKAKNLVIETQKASTSFLQRKLRIGYSRAARLLDILEEQGVVSSQQGTKPRKVLITKNKNETL